MKTSKRKANVPKTSPIAVVGMGGIFPEAGNLQEFWSNLLSKKECVRELPDSFDFDGFYRKEDYYDPDPRARDKTYAKRAGYLPEVEFDPMEFGIPPTALESISQMQLMALLVAKEALLDAGLLEKGKNSPLRSRTGVVLGIAGFGDTAFQLASRLDYPNWRRVLENSGIPAQRVSEIIERLKSLYVEWNEDSFPGFLGNVVAGRIANRFDLRGLNCTVDAACASSMGAIKMAVSELLEGNCDAVLTGGVQVENDPMSFLCFSKTPALSFEGVCRPYDADSDGMLLGTGVGMMVLKRLEDAERDHDRIYAVIRGIGASSDGRSASIYAPDKSGQLAALRSCYEKADLSPGDIQLLEGHGTGTKAGDACEISTILEFFRGVAVRSIALGSVKSQIGHLRAAAGAASMIKLALALYHKVLPPTLNIRKPSPGLAAEDSPFYLSPEPMDWHRPKGESLRRGAVSSFGFGGTNFHIILEEYPGQEAVPVGLHEGTHSDTAEIDPGAQSEKKRLKVAINGFRYLNPSTRVRRDRALNEKAVPERSDLPPDNSSSSILDPPESPQRKAMEKPEQNQKKFKPQTSSSALEMNRTISDKLQWQESLDRLQSQFHENQAGYIDLLSRYMEKQYALIEQISPGPHLDKILDSFGTVIQLLDKNQQRYHDNHDRYLQDQLQRLNGRTLSPISGTPKEMFPSQPLPEKTAAPSDRQRIPLRPSLQNGPYGVNPYSSVGKAPAAPEPSGPSDPASIDNGFLSISVEQIMDKLRDIVADQTGYPKDMLDMDMDLETDMGVDSIKRLEILAAMQDSFPDMPMELEEIGELRTLREIAAFLERYLKEHSDRSSDKNPSLPAGPPPSSSALAGPETGVRLDPADVSRMIDRLRGLVLEKSGFLPDMLTEETDLDAVGLDIVEWIDIIAIMQDEFPNLKVDLQEMEQLNTLGEIERYLCGSSVAEVSPTPGAPSPAVAGGAPFSVTAETIPELAKKPDHSSPEPLSPVMSSSPYQVVISTATLEEDSRSLSEKTKNFSLPLEMTVPGKASSLPQKQSRSIVKKKLSEPDRILSIPAKDHLWVIMDEGGEVGKKLAREICKRGAKAVLLAFPRSLVQYPPQETGEMDRITLPGCDENQCKTVLAEVRKKHGPISGFVYIHPFQKSTAVSITDLFQEKESTAARLAFWMAKHLRPSMDAKPHTDRLCFIAVARMDGELGISGRKPFTIFGGCLSGLIQSLGREWPEVFCRFLDIAPGLSAGEAASIVLKEFADPNVELREVGVDSQGNRCTLELVEKAINPEKPGFLPDKETVFLVSGGGRGITAECAIALAETFHSKFILVGRTSLTEEEPEWARECLDEKSLKQKNLSWLKDRQQRNTPVEVEKMLGPILARRDIRRTLQRIEQKGGEAIYCRADVTDSRKLRRALEERRSRFGGIDALIHGAGNLADKKIQDKTSKDLDRVFTCKVEGLKHLLECLDLDRLRSVVLFSSITSLWGNAGQTDYAMANALLDKFAQCCRNLLPEKMVTAIQWGPWDHGMVTPTLKKIYQEKGIGLISRAAGSRMCVELFKGNVEPQTVLCEKFPIPPPLILQKLQPVQVQRNLLPKANPFLQDHCIDGRPVLPATCAVHWMVQTCEALVPGHGFREIREFKVLKGIVFQKDSPKDYIVQIEPAAIEPHKTIGVKILSQSGKKTVYHYSGEIVLSPHRTPEPMPVYEEMDLSRNGRPREEYYAGVPLFHGKSFQGVREVCNLSPGHITVFNCLPPLDGSMQGQFKVGSWNPYVTDVQLQSILLWSRDFLKAGCLPSSIGRVEQFRPIDFNEEFYVSTRIQSQAQHRLIVEIIVHNAEGKIHARWTDVQLTVSERLHEQFRKNRAWTR